MKENKINIQGAVTGVKCFREVNRTENRPEELEMKVDTEQL